jgi:hypothetical protein
MSDPVRPTDAVIERWDGTRIPLELVYAGLTKNGQHEWQTMTPIYPGDRLHVGVLPGKTTIAVPAGDYFEDGFDD